MIKQKLCIHKRERARKNTHIYNGYPTRVSRKSLINWIYWKRWWVNWRRREKKKNKKKTKHIHDTSIHIHIKINYRFLIQCGTTKIYNSWIKQKKVNVNQNADNLTWKFIVCNGFFFGMGLSPYPVYVLRQDVKRNTQKCHRWSQKHITNKWVCCV